MSTVNPFAPPGALVRDVEATSADYQPVKLFSIRGRIGRLRYLAYSMGMGLVLMLVSAFIGGLASVTGGAAIGFVWVPTIAYIVLTVMWMIQRSHDMNLRGWTVIGAFIPLLGLVWLVVGGTKGENRFGAPPPPNTLGVKILASLVPAVAVLGILAAIALPAYQSYVQKARAVQVR